jgi:hypothetical protein
MNWSGRSYRVLCRLIHRLEVDPELRTILDKSLLSLGRLDGTSDFLKDASLFLCLNLRKEVVLTSRID